MSQRVNATGNPAQETKRADGNNSGGGTAVSPAATGAPGASRRILVVDDEAQIRELLSVYLQRQGYLVSTAATSAETLQVLSETPVALVVLDIGLDGEDGLRLLAQIKATHPTVRVVMLTGMGFVEDLIDDAQRKGADGYVSKVLPLDELLMAIQRVLPPNRPAADAA